MVSSDLLCNKWSCRNGSAIDAGADVNMKTQNGETALMAASLYGQKDMTKLLITRKANVSIKNTDGVTALIIAKNKGHKEVENILYLMLKELTMNSPVKVQRLLTEKGFDPGPVDGIYGKKTEEAIISYQRHAGIDVDGKISNSLIQGLQKYEPEGSYSKRTQLQPKKSFPIREQDDTHDALNVLVGEWNSDFQYGSIEYRFGDLDQIKFNKAGVVNDEIYGIAIRGSIIKVKEEISLR